MPTTIQDLNLPANIKAALQKIEDWASNDPLGFDIVLEWGLDTTDDLLGTLREQTNMASEDYADDEQDLYQLVHELHLLIS